jgi:hypothetical protein
VRALGRAARGVEVNPGPGEPTSAVDLFLQGPAGGVLTSLAARVGSLAGAPRHRSD